MAYTSTLQISIDSRTGERSLRRVEGGLNRVDAAGNRATRSVDNVNQGMSRMRNVALAASGALLGLAAAFGTRDVIKYADAWTNATNQLKQTTSGSAELAEMQSKLVALSKDTRSNFNSTATLYSRLARSTTELGLSSQGLLDIVTTINQSFALSGASAAEASGAIFQLTQGLAAGALRGDEFNSVAEQAPILMKAIAKETNMTLGELRAFAATGGITAETVVRALEGAADTIGGAFADSIVSFGQKMEIARTNMVEFVGTSDELSGSVDVLGDGLIGLTENLNSIVTVATLAAGVYGARLAGAMVTATGATVKNTLATVADARAEAAAATAVTRRTGAELASAKALLSTAQLEARATSGTTAHAFALNQLSVARVRATGAAGAHAAATNAASAAMGRASFAARGLSGAMALLGGPVGIALIAAGSLYYFREELGLVGEQASNTQRRIDALTGSMGAMGETAIRSSIETVRAEMQFLEDQAWNTQRAIANLGPGETFGGSTRAEMQSQLDFIGRDFSSAKDTLAQLEQRLESFEITAGGAATAANQFAGSLSGTTEAANQFAGSLNSLQDKLFPIEAAQRQFRQEQILLQTALMKGEISIRRYLEAFDRLQQSARSDENWQDAYGMDGSGVKELEKMSEAARDLGFTFESAFENAIIEGNSFREVLSGITEDIARIVLRKTVTKPFSDWLGTAISGVAAGFGDGGYTGPGGKNDPAGIVHAGEFVVKKSVVDQPGVMPMLTNLNKGYANGGYVGGSSTSINNAPSIVVNAPVNVTAQPGVSDRDAARQGKAIGAQINARIMQTLAREQRPGGILYQR